MIDWIKGYVLMSFINYGLISHPRSTGREILSVLLRIVSASILLTYGLLGVSSTSQVIKHFIGITIVFLGAYIGSRVGQKFSRVGGYTLMNILVTLAAGVITCIIVYGFILTERVSVSDGFGMFITIAMCAAGIPWLLGLLKSFRIRQVINYLAADDGVEEVDRTFGYKVTPGLFSNSATVSRIGWTEKRWTAQTYKYHIGLFGMSARLLFALVYGMFVGSIISIVATLPAIVRVANPGEPFRLMGNEDYTEVGDQ